MNNLIPTDVAERLIKRGDRVAVAVSGGKDSMALLAWFNSSADYLGAEFFAVNVEHGIRGESSVADSKFVADYCTEKGIEFVGVSVDSVGYAKENNLTVEQAARALRYDCFDRLIKEGKCNKVATAHHQEDNAETVLMRMLRGTGVRGLCGIEENRGGVYIRPMLSVSRAQIDGYAEQNGLPFVVDETNGDSKYRRNFLRNEVLPVIKREYPDYASCIARLSRNAAETERLLDELTPPVEFDGKTVKIKLGAADGLLKRQLSKGFRTLGVFADVEERHFGLLLELAAASNGCVLDMPYGVTAHKEYGYITLTKSKAESAAERPLTLPLEIAQPTRVIKITPYDGKLCKGELVFDAAKLPDGVVVRGRREGDSFTKFGGGTKSLGDYLTDKKVPLRLRDELILLACGGEVLAVCGVEISDKIRADSLEASAITDENKLYKITLEETKDV